MVVLYGAFSTSHLRQPTVAALVRAIAQTVGTSSVEAKLDWFARCRGFEGAQLWIPSRLHGSRGPSRHLDGHDRAVRQLHSPDPGAEFRQRRGARTRGLAVMHG